MHATAQCCTAHGPDSPPRRGLFPNYFGQTCYNVFIVHILDHEVLSLLLSNERMNEWIIMWTCRNGWMYYGLQPVVSLRLNIKGLGRGTGGSRLLPHGKSEVCYLRTKFEKLFASLCILVHFYCLTGFTPIHVPCFIGLMLSVVTQLLDPRDARPWGKYPSPTNDSMIAFCLF